MDDFDNFSWNDIPFDDFNSDDDVVIVDGGATATGRGKDLAMLQSIQQSKSNFVEETPHEGIRCRFWGVTFNNWDTYEEDGRPIDVRLRLSALKENGLRTRQGVVAVQWIMYNHEVAPDTGTRHLQICVQFASQVSWTTLRTYLGSGHVYRIRTSGKGLQRAIDYHSKEDTSDAAVSPHCVELGERPGGRQGERTDLAGVTAAIVNERKRLRDFVKEKDIVALEVYAKYPAGIRMIECQHDNELMDEVEYTKPKVYWLYGPTGSGKSKWAHSQSDLFVYPDLSSGNAWYDGYNGQTKLLIDDIRTDTVKFKKLLNWTDGYKQTLPIKGGSIKLQWKEIYITCPDHYTTVYAGQTGKTDNMAQLTRRLTECYLVLPKGFDENEEPIPAEFEDFIPMKGKPPMSWLQYCTENQVTHVLEWVKGCSWVNPVNLSAQRNPAQTN